MNKILFLLPLISILLAVCEDNEIEYFEQCYHEDDIEFLQGLIDNSQIGGSTP